MKGGKPMKEKLYTIPVNEAYNSDCECPLCYIIQALEDKALEYTMGPSYMEDDVRARTDELGFCGYHLSLLYQDQNRLGLALILKSHMDKTITKVSELSSPATKKQLSFYSRKKNETPLVSYLNELETSCFVCNKVNNTFDRYIATIFHLYKQDEHFRKRSKKTNGYCTGHYGLLYDKAPEFLRGQLLDSFIRDLNNVYLENMRRVRDDLDWFINKFDYRYKDAPWKNSKDALQRAITKTSSL